MLPVLPRRRHGILEYWTERESKGIKAAHFFQFSSRSPRQPDTCYRLVPSYRSEKKNHHDRSRSQTVGCEMSSL
jgi:hypothetical protein